MENKVRLPHAILERGSRINKARKIVSLVGQDRFSHCARILEIGCGSGVISSAIATMSTTAEVFAVDVADNRIETEGFKFSVVQSTRLPFPDEHFDLVITNHVIEHVGSESEQIRHLQEIKRVLSKKGVAYLAVPNKWRLVEPHYRLPLLSWLPQRFSDAYVRSTNRGSYYDCRPLGAYSIEGMFARCSLEFQNVTERAIRETLRIERPHSFLTRHVIDSMPGWTTRLAIPVIPTMVYLLTRPGQ